MNNNTYEIINLLELGAGPLARIVASLDIRDICSAAATCKSLYEVTKNDQIWQLKARELYPLDTLNLSGTPYHSYMQLVKDKNEWNASLYISFKNFSSDYKYNRPDYYFECQILGIQLNRADDTLRLYFDARGEGDLRHPSTSSLGIVVHRRSHKNRLELRKILAHLRDSRHALSNLVNNLQAEISHSVEKAQRHYAALQALNSNGFQITGIERELYHGSSTSSFADLLTVLRPAKQHCCIERPGHYKGYVEFSAATDIDAVAASLPDQYRLKKEVEKYGIDLIFCYANPVPVMPQGDLVDYHAVHVLESLPGSTLLGNIQERGVYVQHETLLRDLENEDDACDQNRWEHVAWDMTSRVVPGWSDGGVLVGSDQM